jgi:peptide deformylase
MAVLNILVFPHNSLRNKCRPVTDFDESLHRFLDDMAETMYMAKGVGLAAPQVGDDRCIVLIDAEHGDKRGTNLLELINPKIVEYRGQESKCEEGCLSFPDIFVPVMRYPFVRVEAVNRHGQPFIVEGDDLLAIALQHELDHLKGTLLIDRVNSFKQSYIRKQMKRRFDPDMLYWQPDLS